MKRISVLLLATALALSCAAPQRTRPPAPPDAVASLKLAARKLDNAILATKRMIQRSRGADYLPSLHMRLAELYTEKARYSWLIVYETRQARGDKGRSLEVPEARLLKNLAIGEYDRVLREFKDFRRADEALFLMAHEYRELGDFAKMREAYEKLIATYPKSRHRHEAFLILGDTEFEKGDLDAAERFYKMILGETEGHVHPLARYKMGWVRINKRDCKGAVGLFEQILRRKDTPHGSKTIVATQRSFNLRHESLVDLAYCYPEVYPKKLAAPFFRELAASSSDYVAAMRRVANRFYVKQMYPESAAALMDVLANAAYDEDTLDAARRLYEVAAKGGVNPQAGPIVDILGRVMELARFDHRIPAATRKKVVDEFEVYARDIATKVHLAAKQASATPLYSAAADAYAAYVRYFDESKRRLEMQENRAEALLAANRFFEAGLAFEEVAVSAKPGPARPPAAEGGAAAEGPMSVIEASTNSFAAFQRALETGGLPPRQRVTAWAGLRAVGRRLIEVNPTDPKLAAVKFAIAKSYYDGSDYRRASELFYALSRQYPSAPEAIVGAHLALDSLLLLEDFPGLVSVGRRMLADTRLGDSRFKEEVSDIVAKTEQRQVADLVIAGGGGDERLVSLARQQKGSQLGEQALFNALILARDAGDIERFYGLGEEFLATYPQSNQRTVVMTALAKAATDRADFAQAAKYLETAFAAEPASKDALDRIEAAASIRAYFGSDAAGPDILELVARGSNRQDELLVVLARSGNYAVLEKLLGDARLGGTVADFLRGLLAFRRGDDEAALALLAPVAQERGADGLAAAMVARARFLVGELSLGRFKAATADDGDLAQVITAKSQLLAEVDRSFAAAIQSGDAEWALAAVVRASDAYRQFAAFLTDLPLPPDLPADEEKQVRAALKAKADEAERRATELRGQCAAKAQKNPVFSEAVRSCLTSEPAPADVQVFARIAGHVDTDPPGAAALRKDLQKKPNDAEKLLKLAEIYLGTGDVAMALLILDRMEELEVDSSETNNLRGVALERAGEAQAAFGAFQRAVELDGGNKRARLNLAAHYAAYGYTARAKAELKKAGEDPIVRGDPSEHPSLSTLGRLGAGGGGR